MDPLHLAHLVLVSLWGGLVVAEGVVELASGDAAARRHAARLHYWMDLWAELPLLAGVIGTGAVLTARAGPPSGLLLVKVGAGLVAVTVNLYCVLVVVRRHRHVHDDEAVWRFSRQIRLSGLGVPFALAAAYLGLVYFRG